MIDQEDFALEASDNTENAGEKSELSSSSASNSSGLTVPPKLLEISEEVHQGVKEVKETVRTLLSWFGAMRRGYYVVNSIQKALAEVNLATDPDFTVVYIDAEISFVPTTEKKIEGSNLLEENRDSISSTELPDAKAESVVDELVSGAIQDPTFRIGKLEAANNTPIQVSPDSTILEATTLMMYHDFSQLPVMQGDREIKGVISWESIGKNRALKLPCEKARDCIETIVPQISADSSLFSAIDLIVKHGYVLVLQKDKKVSGIVTTTDLSLQFRQLAEPFLLVGEIENYIRRLIDGRFTAEQLSSVRNPNDEERTITTVADLTFGEYLRLLENPKYWEVLSLPIDRAIFIKKLDRVREIRNDVMHFDPDPFAEEDLQTLRLFANFMRSLDIKKA